MNVIRYTTMSVAVFAMALSVSSCGDDDDGMGLSPAQRHGVGAACSADSDCFVGDTHLRCLPFKGGYCGLEGCQDTVDCPPGSGCVAHEDGHNYCFLLCVDKPQCNYTRPPEIEANCSSKITFADGGKESKACVPPS
jgi:hypothetical protein